MRLTFSPADLVSYICNVHSGIYYAAMAHFAPSFYLQGDGPAISTYQVVLSPLSWHVDCHPSDAQLLLGIFRRDARGAVHFRTHFK